jgi:siroheme synthase-like protein
MQTKVYMTKLVIFRRGPMDSAADLGNPPSDTSIDSGPDELGDQDTPVVPFNQPPGYPVVLNLSGRSCLVVGGGPVAARKARGLLAAGALVTVIAPDLCPEMESLSALRVERRSYAAGDASPFRLVVTATGRQEVDSAVFEDADAAGVWVNSADDRAHSSFILPAVHRDGAVCIAVTTGGTSPALASWLRDQLAEQSGTGLGDLAQFLAQARTRLRDAGISSESVDWKTLLNGPLPSLVQKGQMEHARTIIDAAIGADLTA